MTPPKVLGAPKPWSSVMMSSTLGAPFGGTTRGGHQGFDSEALSLITPPNSDRRRGKLFSVDRNGGARRARNAGDLLSQCRDATDSDKTCGGKHAADFHGGNPPLGSLNISNCTGPKFSCASQPYRRLLTNVVRLLGHSTFAAGGSLYVPSSLRRLIDAGSQVEPAARRRRQPIGFLGTRLVLQQHGEATHKLTA